MDTRDAVLLADDSGREPLAVPEWNVAGFIRRFTLAETFALRQWQREGLADDQEPDRADSTVKTVVFGFVDAAGRPIFRREDLAALKEKSGLAIARVFTAIADLNGLTEGAAAAIKKNSPTILSGNSCTDSPPATAAPSPSSSAPSTPAS